MKIFLDVGHGGTDSGAVGNGIIEKNINLIVAKEVQRILSLNSIEVLMSRQVDATVSLARRCELANSQNADYFISIHHNANNGTTVGTEIYHSVNGGNGKTLSQTIGDVFKANSRKVSIICRESEKEPKKDYYYVIRHTEMPSIIVEAGYIDSKDYINFDTTEELLEEAKTIAKGILIYLGIERIKYSEVEEPHWALQYFDYLNNNGIEVHEQRFDDKITRGEAMSLVAKLLEKTKRGI